MVIYGLKQAAGKWFSSFLLALMSEYEQARATAMVLQVPFARRPHDSGLEIQWTALLVETTSSVDIVDPTENPMVAAAAEGSIDPL